MKRFVLILSILFTVGIYADANAQLSIFGRKEKVKTVSVEQLHKLLNEQQESEKQAKEDGKEQPKASFVLVDVRAAKEQAVSMIPGAITAQQYEKNRKRFAGKTVIAYCTVGVRSEEYARKLVSSGKAALNFKGSILAWCEANHPLVTPDGKPTKRVHTYSARYNKVPSKYTAVY